MVIGYDDSAAPTPDMSDPPSDVCPALDVGILVALSLSYGTDDPDSGSWDDSQYGRIWTRSSSPGSAASPLMRRWQQLEAAGPGHGWRDLRLQKNVYPAATNALTFSPASTQAADVAWTTLDLSTLLDDLQDAGQVEAEVHAVKLLVSLKVHASATLGADDGYIAFRKPSDTLQEKRVAVAVAGRTVWAEIEVELDGEEIEWSLVVPGGGTKTTTYAAWITKVLEPL